MNNLNNQTREEAIKALEKDLARIFEYVKSDESFFIDVTQTYKKYKDHYKGLEDCYQKTLNSYEKALTRYSGSVKDGYSSTNTKSIELEKRIWNFAENNPEKWYLMIEKIAFTDQSANIFTPDGFSFMDHFIHNGIYDDWYLRIAIKDKDVFFFDSENEKLQKEFEANSYQIQFLEESSIQKVLDIVEDKITLSDTTKDTTKDTKKRKIK